MTFQYFIKNGVHRFNRDQNRIKLMPIIEAKMPIIEAKMGQNAQLFMKLFAVSGLELNYDL